ncbi:hypothetical protein P2R12_22755 [Cytobacillus oceanisediminis]|uniref:hypothetical protein n=1 Tax=Cytobacillus oceanisediminis TaxID=665099 RepID=UPI0023D9D669|nr:hypothetical protein [Cytobacillus oceanisediminis]MDF2039765.1 hypothetical protein [Cytobacillus oceanisediminis]
MHKQIYLKRNVALFLAGNSSNNHKGIVVLNYFNILCVNGAIGEFSTKKKMGQRWKGIFEDIKEIA